MKYSPTVALGRRIISACIGTGVLATAAAGCGFGAPRARLGYLPTATFAVVFADPDNLGRHAYEYSPFEHGGIVYTCSAGHMDIDHIRGSADLTRHMVNRVRQTLSAGHGSLSFTLAGETSVHLIEFAYPADWRSRPDRDRIIEEIALGTGPYLAYNATIWHEILTWFGVRFMAIEPEFNSAFSWDDLYSNVLGTHLALEAMNDPRHDFDTAMTLALAARLKELGVQPRRTAITASRKVSGTWYTGNLIPDLKMRNFDIGLDGFVTPTLIEGVEGCSGAKPAALAAPTLERLKQNGFSMAHRITPNVFEQEAIFRAAGSRRIFFETHVPILLAHIKNDAARRGYQYTE